MKQVKLYHIIGLAAELKLPAKWLKEQAQTGKIPCLKVGRKMLFSLEAVKQALLDLAAEGHNDE